MNELPLTLAISEYDHVRDLVSGLVKAEGIALRPLRFSVEEIFYRFLRYREWDASEVSFAKYVSMRAAGDESLIAIPVFPSRIFRHSSIYVRRDGGVRLPADLRGARVGIPEWSQTAAVYSRGALVHQYGVGLDEVHWVQSGVNQAGREEKVGLNLPAGVTIERITDRSLDAMLRAGELDAIFTAHPPQSFEDGDPAIVRLFPNYREVESAYYRETGIFPIMHVIAIRAEILERAPWVAMNLFRAFEEAKQRSVARAREVTASRFPIPWSHAYASEAQAAFGEDYWPYGIEKNRRTLDAFLQFAYEQGVCARRLDPGEIFAGSTATAFRV